MAKILLVGHAGSQNRGCEAIVRCTVHIIRRHIKIADFTILSRDPRSDLKTLLPDLPGLVIPHDQQGPPKRYTLQWLVEGLHRRLLPGSPSQECFANRDLYRGSDVVISVGGDNFNDHYNYSPVPFLEELSFARSQGALTVIWAASIGPFHTRRFEKKWVRELREVDLITVRENFTLQYLKSLGIEENVRLVADPAFLVKPDSRGVIESWLNKSGKLVGIGISNLISHYGTSQQGYLNALTLFCEQILSDATSGIVLVPHVYGEPGDQNDKELCEVLAGKLGHKDRVYAISADYNACQLKHIIGQCDFFIGARTHSTIASLSSLVPTLSIAYSAKAYGINEQIFGHTEYVLGMSEMSESSLKEKFLLLCKDRSEIVERLSQRLPIIEAMSERGGQYLAEVLRLHSVSI